MEFSIWWVAEFLAAAVLIGGIVFLIQQRRYANSSPSPETLEARKSMLRAQRDEEKVAKVLDQRAAMIHENGFARLIENAYYGKR